MLGIRCQLIRDAFEGGDPDDPSNPEWPPSWMRLFSALVSVADHDSDPESALLRRLEELPAPTIHADPPWQGEAPELAFRRSAWVPENAVKPEGSAGLMGRKNQSRSWARFVPRSAVVTYSWEDSPLGDEERELLGRLCRRVPYLGRSTSPVVVEVVERLTEQLPRLEPAASEIGEEGQPTTSVRVPHPGALMALSEAYERKQRGEVGDPWAIGTFQVYTLPGATQPEDFAQSPYREFVVFALEGPRRDGRHAVEFTDLLRKAVMANLGTQVPEVHGHGPPGTVQCAFLALPFVGQAHADGHLVGLAIAIPEMLEADLRELWAAIGAVTAKGLYSPALGTFGLRRLSKVELRRAPLALQPWRWNRPARVWVTAYPAVLDRFLKKGDDLGALVRLTVRNSGYPEPVAVSISERPFSEMLPGALDLIPAETKRPGHQEGFRPYRHLVLTFPKPVRGPVVVGSMRHYGLGLCVPRWFDSKGA